MTTHDRNNLGEQLSAYLDGELSREEAAVVEATLRDDEKARAVLADLRVTAECVASLPKRPAPATLATKLMADIEQVERAKSQWATPGHVRSRLFSYRSLLVTAAVFLVGVSVGMWGIVQLQSNRLERKIAMGELGDMSPSNELPSKRVHPRDEFAAVESRMAKPGSKEGDSVDGMPSPKSERPVDPAAEGSKYASDARGQAGGEFEVMGHATNPAEELLIHGGAYEESKSRAAHRPNRAVESPPALEKIDSESVAESRLGRSRQLNAVEELRLDVVCMDAFDLQACEQQIDTFVVSQQKLGVSRQSLALQSIDKSSAIDAMQDAQALDVEQQIDVPASQLPGLVRVLESAPSQKREVTFSVGRLVRAAGWEQTRRLTDMVQSSVMLDDGASNDSESVAPSSDSDVLDALLNQLGVALPPSDRADQPAPLEKESSATAESSGFRAADRFQPHDPVLSVTIRLRAPAPQAPEGPPGQLVPNYK